MYMSGKGRTQFLDALADRYFLPFLRRMPRAPGNVPRKDVEARWETRRRRRGKAVVAAGST